MKNLLNLERDDLLETNGGINLYPKDGLIDELKELAELINSWFS